MFEPLCLSFPISKHAPYPCLHCAGFSARQRKLELERLNEQLRKINLNLRQQARAGTVYAPGLMYAPTPMPNVSIGSENDGTNPGGAATLVVPGPRPAFPEDSDVTTGFILYCLCCMYIA